MTPNSTYEESISQEILSLTKDSITEVNNLSSINTIAFSQDQYSGIVSLIEEKAWTKLKLIIFENNDKFREYLDILQFSDQNNVLHTVTVYDNDELTHYPQIIDIF